MTLVRRVIHALNNPKILAWTVLTTWIIASALFSLIEHDGPISGLWWGIVTGSTTGYGDYSPKTTAGRGIGALFILTMMVLLIFVNAHITARAVEDNSPAAFTADEQERMFAILDNLTIAGRVAVQGTAQTYDEIRAEAWDQGFTACAHAHLERQSNAAYPIGRQNPYKKEHQ